MGIFLADKNPAAADFTHTKSYLKKHFFGADVIKSTPNFVVVVKNMGVCNFLILIICSQNKVKSILQSHLHDVCPYGKSQNIKSTDASSKDFISSKQFP